MGDGPEPLPPGGGDHNKDMAAQAMRIEGGTNIRKEQRKRGRGKKQGKKKTSK